MIANILSPAKQLDGSHSCIHSQSQLETKTITTPAHTVLGVCVYVFVRLDAQNRSGKEQDKKARMILI